jgi:hypothetical protein
MNDRELMQQALEALDWAADCIEPRKPHNCDCPVCVASTALRERLAREEAQCVAGESKLEVVPAKGSLQPEREEPETVMAEYKFQTYAAYKTDGEMKIGVVPAMKEGKDFTISKPWVGLTDEEVWDTASTGNEGSCFGDLNWQDCTLDFARAIEAKLKEKNA